MCRLMNLSLLIRVFYIWLCLSNLLNLKSEVTRRVENVIGTLIAIMGVNNEEILFAIYSQCECISS